MEKTPVPRSHSKGFMYLHSQTHIRTVPFNWKRFGERFHTFIRWQRLSISFFGLSEIQLLFYCNSNPRPSYICGQFSLFIYVCLCLCLCLVYVYQSRISSTHEFYIMINIVNKTKNILASKKKLLYWNGYNDIGGQSASWLVVIPTVHEWKRNRQHVSHTQLTLSEKQKLSIPIEHLLLPFFLSLGSARSIFPMICFALIRMQQPLYGFSFALLPIALWILVYILYITQLGYDAIFRK